MARKAACKAASGSKAARAPAAAPAASSASGSLAAASPQTPAQQQPRRGGLKRRSTEEDCDRIIEDRFSWMSPSQLCTERRDNLTLPEHLARLRRAAKTRKGRITQQEISGLLALFSEPDRAAAPPPASSCTDLALPSAKIVPETCSIVLKAAMATAYHTNPAARSPDQLNTWMATTLSCNATELRGMVRGLSTLASANSEKTRSYFA
eukprot:11155190-Lingulodinium_polyedra.AAC.1